MKKIIFSVLVLLSAAAISFAGDAAVFNDIGFSEDGLTYVFSQYGKTDKDFEAWAEIYTVDVVSNDYVPHEVYKTAPSEATVSLSGKKAYDELLEKTEWKMAKYKLAPSSPENLIYVSENESKNPEEEILFKDFDKSTSDSAVYYHIKLVPSYQGSGKNTKSCFYISLEEKDESGNVVLSKKVGTPDFWRSGITGYRIVKIFSDTSGKSLIFVVEKKLEDDTGISIRYMVEAIRL